MFAKSNKNARRSKKSSSPAMMHPLEDRRLFAGVAPDAVKVVDVSGPVNEMVEAGGQVYIAVPLASGGSTLRIYGSDGDPAHSRLLLDLTHPDNAWISSIQELTATNDGRIFFTASAPGGRHLFELTPHDGKLYKLTDGTNKFYTNVTAAGSRVYLQEGNSDQIYTIAPGSRELTPVVAMNVDTDFHAASDSVFFIGPDESLWRSNGTAGGTLKVSGDYRVSRADFFTTNEFVVFEGSKTGENTSLFIVGLGETQPQKVADDYALFNNRFAEHNGWAYFSGGFYNTSPNAQGRQLYRVNKAGTVEMVAKVNTSNGGSHVEGISAIGNFIYFTGHDGENLPSQGIGDRELYKYDTTTGQTKVITTGNALYPVEVGKGVLSNYYFVAAPDKENARFGSRALYRTNPVTDEIEIVPGLPTVQDSNGKDYQRVRDVAVGANGFFFTADSSTMGREADLFFSQAPFSYYDPAKRSVTITGTDFADFTETLVENGELIIRQNGYEARYNVADVDLIEAFMKKGDDGFKGNPSVFIPTYVIGDEGADRIQGSSGNDTLTGGAGMNRLFGGDGNDMLNGSNGLDVIGGEYGDDRITALGHNDVIYGGHGSDWIQCGLGDDLVFGGLGVDRIYGSDGNDKIHGQLSADLIDAGGGDDWVDGGPSADTIHGNLGRDTLLGNGEDDELFTLDGELDYVDGGEGNDTLSKDLEEETVDLVEVIL